MCRGIIILTHCRGPWGGAGFQNYHFIQSVLNSSTVTLACALWSVGAVGSYFHAFWEREVLEPPPDVHSTIASFAGSTERE